MNIDFPKKLPSRLYHVTQKSRLPSIMKHGLKRSYFGDIHGEMQIQPSEPTIYLSSNELSGNLNGKLFDEAESDPLIILEIDSRCIDLAKIYPDDALFIGFGQEDILEDPEDISETMRIPLNEAEDLLKHLVSLKDNELVMAMKDLWPWYLSEHGEISVAQDIPPHAIVAVHDFETHMLICERRQRRRQRQKHFEGLSF